MQVVNARIFRRRRWDWRTRWLFAWGYRTGVNWHSWI